MTGPGLELLDACKAASLQHTRLQRACRQLAQFVGYGLAGSVTL